MIVGSSLGITYALHSRQKRLEEEAAHNRARSMTEEDIATEHAFRQKQIADIKAIFLAIKNSIQPYQQEESLLNLIYADVYQQLENFEAQLISEVADVIDGDNKPLTTAEKLQTAIQDVFDTNTSDVKKNESIRAFYNEARNAKYSAATKACIGGLSGILLATAYIGAMTFLLTTPISIPAMLVTGAVCTIFLGSFGALFGAEQCSEHQNDERGRDVSMSLKTLVTERNKFHQQHPSHPLNQVPTENKEENIETIAITPVMSV